MISVIVKLSKDMQAASRFVWSIENSFTHKEDCKNVEILFLGQKIFEIKTQIPFRVFNDENGEWVTLTEAAKRALGDVLIFSDINIMFTQDVFQEIRNCLDDGKIIIPKIISSEDNRVIDFGAIPYRGNLIFPFKGLLYDCDYLPPKHFVKDCSKLMLSTKKEFFLSRCSQTDSFEAFFKACHANMAKICAEGQINVYYCGNVKQIPCKTDDCTDNQSIQKIMQSNFLHLNKKNLCKSYLLVKIGLNQNFTDIKKQLQAGGLNIIATYDFPDENSSTKIDLIKRLPLEIIDYHTAVIYFVPSFLSLYDNSVWFSARDISYDLVVDENLNVLHLYQIANMLI